MQKFSNPAAEWHSPKCLKQGASHKLMQAAGLKKCWNCGEAFAFEKTYSTDELIKTYYERDMIDLLKKQTPFAKWTQ